jgi:hypothetical protein
MSHSPDAGMTRQPSAVNWAALRLHIAGILAVPVCLAAGVFELERALAGNQLSWAYTLEWPLIAAYVVYMWRRLAREGRQTRSPGPMTRADTLCDSSPSPAGAVTDPDLLAWRQYLARLHTSDPPGGPPAR